MKTISRNIEFEVFENPSELPDAVRVLVETAVDAARNAYSPYSKFKVGAAIELKDGTVVTGNNQENAAYPSGLCAERTAAFYASAHYPEQPFQRIAITSISNDIPSDKPVTPCGACRQALLEYEQKFNADIEIWLAAEKGQIIRIKSVSDMLPFSFGASYLE
ncbi:cytidine deaminase [Bacteroidales bacterium OttesenSCG-928-B11]|nr:cytidine deaminase [Bacteroidales bacterium OttesenSCG-928-E04]MDL2309347.1 cytidine deaminase [Bacteroidales bacterium OttesenSCG-928-C03]MDL2311550.1 cytidine deaminase [Bacteroidales bacterium OttesenSCG-928-B11]MDL2325976.1 cytidine deaminase [Bacteroidales bacterium OttesenSCG-928-A14]